MQTKMAADNNTDAQAEKDTTVNEKRCNESCEEAQTLVASTKAKDSKLTLYHWTQSFNSQKVGAIRFQHHACVDRAPVSSVSCIAYTPQTRAVFM